MNTNKKFGLVVAIYLLSFVPLFASADTISVNPNPIKICDGSTLTTVTVTANASVNYDIHVGSPTGDLFAQQAANTQTVKQTGNWVSDGMVFYLTNTATGQVLSSVTVNFTSQGCSTTLTATPNPIQMCSGTAGTATINANASVDYEVRVDSPTGTLFTQQAANTPVSKMTGNWVTNGMKFYLVATNSQNVLTSLVVNSTANGCSFANQSSPFNNIKSVVWYEFGPTYSESLINLQQQIPRIKQAGFNTVWLVTPWKELNPEPLSNSPVYNEENFKALKQTLDTLRTNGMQAFIGLNYLGNGWSPKGIDYCNWVNDPTQYQAFVKYANEFLRRLDGYESMVNIVVFTENAEPCNLNSYSNASQIANILRPTLGSFPSQISSTLRSKFKIGYHDYNLLNLGWAQGTSPISNPNPFDFVSMVAYDLESKTDNEIKTEINLRASRFKALYPNTPLIIGEFGARSCSTSQDSNQSRVNSAIIKVAQDNKYGFNLWSWKPATTDDCSKQLSGYGYAIIKDDGSPKLTATTIAKLLNGSISSPVTINPPLNPVLPPTNPTSITELQALIKSLLQQVEQLQALLKSSNANKTSNASFCYAFNSDLKIGSVGSEISSLVKALVKEGVAPESGNFASKYDSTIASYVKAFQEKYKSEILTPNGLNSGTGYFGKSTRTKLNSIYKCY